MPPSYTGLIRTCWMLWKHHVRKPPVFITCACSYFLGASLHITSGSLCQSILEQCSSNYSVSLGSIICFKKNGRHYMGKSTEGRQMGIFLILLLTFLFKLLNWLLLFQTTCRGNDGKAILHHKGQYASWLAGHLKSCPFIYCDFSPPFALFRILYIYVGREALSYLK